MAFVEIFTDGACEPNPGPGGWGAIIRFGATEQELCGADPATTNNRMELMGPIMALESLSVSCNVVIVSDSKYVVNGATSGMPKWRKQGWRLRNSWDSKPPLNLDLWHRLDRAISQHHVRFQWVRGHNGHIENERADRLAVDAMRQARVAV
jgi:ribonuclease HI